MTTRLNSRQALVAAGAITGFLKPVLAQDARFDPASVLGDITSKNFRSSVPRIVDRVKHATRNMIARDQAPDPQDLRALLESLAGEQGAEDDAEREGVNPANTGRTFSTPPRSENPSNPGKPSDRDRTSLGDDDEDHAVLTFLQDKLDSADFQKAKSLVDDIRENSADNGDTQSEYHINALLQFLQGKISDADLEKAAELVLTGSGDDLARDAARRRRRARVLAMDARVGAAHVEEMNKKYPMRVLHAGEPIHLRRIKPVTDEASRRHVKEMNRRYPPPRVL